MLPSIASKHELLGAEVNHYGFKLIIAGVLSLHLYRLAVLCITFFHFHILTLCDNHMILIVNILIARAYVVLGS